MDGIGLRRVLPYAVVVIIVAVVVALLIVSLPPPSTTVYAGEIRNYEGKNLTAIANIKENNIRGLQHIAETSYRLKVTGLVNKTLQLTYSDVISQHQSYKKVVTLLCVEGWRATILWEGVLVKDLLIEAGANMSAPTVIFYASDGFSTALPMNYIVNNDIILAYKMNNVTMPTEKGFPFELVAENQYGYKWIKWLTQIEVSDDPNYLGYWEKRGYPNNATLR